MGRGHCSTETCLLVCHGVCWGEEGWEHLHALNEGLIKVLEQVGIG